MIDNRNTTDILNDLQTDINQGLSEELVNDRLTTFGKNEIREAEKLSPLAMFFIQFKGVMSILLIVAGIISAITGDLKDTIVIFFVVILNAVMGFVQEFKAEKAITALKKMSVPLTKVIRNSNIHEVSSNMLVPGDIVRIQAGDIVPADGRLLEVSNLTIEEATLTGESVPVEKTTVETVNPELTINDRVGDVFMGTTIAKGRGTFVITATGMNTELGAIAEMISRSPIKHTPLQKRLGQLGTYLAIGAVAICVVVFLAGIFQKRDLEEMLMTSISLAVAAVPESLTAVITISLALGAQRMSKRNALIRKLPAVETLGCVTAICSDKTGTLTQNIMRVENIFAGGVTYRRSSGEFVIEEGSLPDDNQTEARLLLEAISLCNDTEIQKSQSGEMKYIGDPSETSLIDAAIVWGIDVESIRTTFNRFAEIPFDSSRKRMTTIHKTNDGDIKSFTKGAIDTVLPLCKNELLNGSIRELTDERRTELFRESELYAERGIRVMSGASGTLDNIPDIIDADIIENNLIFLGFVAISDPLRPEAKTAVEKCKTGGIEVRMITGDHKLTAKAIGKDLGIIDSDSQVCIGTEIENMDDSELSNVVNRCRVYARVSPEHKVRIVSALQTNNQIVAMTGDGVNDAPSLKRSDVGVAMGITGTDVSREASDIILTDDNFATIVSAVEEGRIIYDNIRKFVRYTIATNFGEVLTMFFALLLGLPLPLLPIQILWINLVTDGLPALALGVEPAEGDVMKRSPRAPDENLFAHGLWQHIIWVGALMAIGTLVMFKLEIELNGEDYARTMAFYTIAAFQLFHVMAIRRERESSFKTSIFLNKSLLYAVVGSFALQIAITYIKPFQSIFYNVTIDLLDMLLCTAVASTVFFAVEIEKFISQKKLRK